MPVKNILHDIELRKPVFDIRTVGLTLAEAEAVIKRLTQDETIEVLTHIYLTNEFAEEFSKSEGYEKLLLSKNLLHFEPQISNSKSRAIQKLCRKNRSEVSSIFNRLFIDRSMDANYEVDKLLALKNRFPAVSQLWHEQGNTAFPNQGFYNTVNYFYLQAKQYGLDLLELLPEADKPGFDPDYKITYVHVTPEGVLDLTWLDLGRIDIYGEEEKKNLHEQLKRCQPRKIILNDALSPFYGPNSFFAGESPIFGGVITCMESVTEIEMASFIKEATFNRSGVHSLVDLVTRYCPNTEILLASNNRFEGKQVNLIPRARFQAGYLGADFGKLVSAPNLKSLSLSGCGLTDKDIFCPDSELYKDGGNEGSCYLTALPAGGNLRELNLSGNNLTSRCAAKLLEWLLNSKIEHLDLSGNEIADIDIAVMQQAAVKNGSQVLSGVKGQVRADEQALDVNALRQKLRGKRITITGIKG